MIVVQIPYPGISPEDSERLLVKPMETYLRSIEGLKTITARAYQGMAVIILEFDVNFQKEKALEDVRAQVETARSELPQDAKQPIVQEFNTSLFPVLTVALSGQIPERTLLKIARDLRDEIKQIPTVLDASITGERQEMLEIVIDPAKLESHGITQAEMFSAIANNNRLIAAGSIDTGHGSFSVKVPAVLENPQDVLGLPIRSTADATVTLGDVAQVHKTFYDPTSYVRVNGQPAIALDITKRIGANIIDNNRQVRELVSRAAQSWPTGVHVDYLLDNSKYIRNSLGSLSDSIILAIVLVMIIIVAALGLRSGLLVGAAIPTSFLISFLVLDGMGLTLNFMIMFAMVLAVGILVDGPIIVVEYADRKMTEGAAPREAFADGARRMFWPVVSATATMIAAFLPMLFWPDVTGKFMSYFPITLIIVLGASMFVALIFLPVLGGLLGKPPPYDAAHEKAIEASETGDWHDIPGITGWYAHLAERLSRYPGRVIGGAVAAVVVIVALYACFNHGTAFFVETDPDFANVLISARGNLSANEKRDIVMGVERIVATVDGIKSIDASSGEQGQTLNSQGGVPVDNIGQIAIELKDFRERRNGNAILEEIRRKTANLPGVHVEVRMPDMGPPAGKDVMIDVSSDDYAALLRTTAMIRRHFDGLKEMRDVEDTRPLPGIEWNIDIDRDLANRFGANAQTIGTAVQLVTDGILVGEYRPDDSTQQVDIRVRYPARSRGIHALDDVRVSTPGGMVPISNFVKLRPAQQVNSIERVDAHRVYHVRANLNPGTLASDEVAKLKSWLATQSVPGNVRITFKGADEQQNQSERVPHRCGVHGAVPDRAGSRRDVQQFLPRGPHPDRGRAGNGRRAARHTRHGRNILAHHVWHRHAGARRHRGESQHRADRYVPATAPERHGPDRGGGAFERPAPAARLPHNRHRHQRADSDDARRRNQFLDSRNHRRWRPKRDMGSDVDRDRVRSGILEMITLGLVPALLALPYRLREARAARRIVRAATPASPHPKPAPQAEAHAAE